MTVDWFEVAESMRAAMRSGGSGVVDHPGGGYVQWADASAGRLHVEASDGGDYSAPMAGQVVEALVAAGWAPPDEQLRNCWFQVTEETDVPAAVGLVKSAWSVLDSTGPRVQGRPSARGRVGATARQSITDATAVLTLVSAAGDSPRRAAAAVRPAWDRLVAQTVRAQLASLDVDTIRRFGPSGMRMAALRAAGARSVLDIHDAREPQLETVPGVGQFTARAAKATASAIRSELVRSFEVRQLDARSRDHQPVILSVFVALRVRDVVGVHAQGMAAVGGRFPDLVASARPAGGRFSYWLAGRAGKAEALAALDELEAAVEWVDASGLSEAMREAVALSEGAAEIRRAIEDYWRRPNEYHRAVSGLPGWAGPRPTGAAAPVGSDAALAPGESSVGRVADGPAPWATAAEPGRPSSPPEQQRPTPSPPPPPAAPNPKLEQQPETEPEPAVQLEPAPEPQPEGEAGRVGLPSAPFEPPVRLPLAAMVAVSVTSGSRRKALEESGCSVDQLRSLVEAMVDSPGHSLSVPEAASLLAVSLAEVPARVSGLKKVLNAPGATGISFDRVSHVLVLDPSLVERALQAGSE